MAQTAVEWFVDTLVEQGYFKKLPISEYHKAITMEKEQIVDAFINGEHQQGYVKEAEQYYKETYGK
jgi:hypothetical protein